MEGEEEQEDQEEDGDGIRTEQLEFVANGVMYSVQTSNRVEVNGRWKGSPEVNPKSLTQLLKANYPI